MVSERLGEFDTWIEKRPEVKILVYLALVLALVAVPYIIVTYKIPALGSRSELYACVTEGLFAASAVGALFLMRLTPGALPITSYGLRPRGLVLQTAIGCAIGLAVMSAVMNLLRLRGNYVLSGINHHFTPWLPLVLYLFVAIFEETTFRGFIFVTLEQKWGSFIAITTTSLIFGLSHLLDPVPGMSFAHHLRAALFIGLEVGVLLNAAFLLTRNLWLGIGIHWAWNFFEGPFFGVSVSGMNEPAPLFLAHTIGRNLLTGGIFGPEAGVVCLVVGTVTGLLMLRAAIRAGQWRPNPELTPVNLPNADSFKQQEV